jgi:hypothetical protein
MLVNMATSSPRHHLADQKAHSQGGERGNIGYSPMALVYHGILE